MQDNDRIFKIDGILSKEVFDGINQAVNYNIEQRLRGLNSKGIAVIGSIHGMDLTSDEKNRLKLLGEHYHNVDIFTYEDMIEKSESTLAFWKSEQKDTN